MSMQTLLDDQLSTTHDNIFDELVFMSLIEDKNWLKEEKQEPTGPNYFLVGGPYANYTGK